MKLTATVANGLWMVRAAATRARFRRALGEPAAAQAAWLNQHVQRHSNSAFGAEYGFRDIDSVASFQRRVPLCEYGDLEPFIERLQRGERDVLACGPVTHLAPTSGSTGARKLIPFTRDLQAGFDAAVGPWMLDLVRQRPRLLGGPAYWSISPLADHPDLASSVSIGYADDAEYLGGASAWLVRRAMAVPADVRHVRDEGAFWALTLLALLRQRDLRVISVWHPSFLDVLVRAAEPIWPELLSSVASGSCAWADALPARVRDHWITAPAPDRSRELQRVGSQDWPRWWPQLQVVSCWGEQAAEPGWLQLRRQLPSVLVQAKGLIATEGVVTIPFQHVHVLAVTSHFFEFIDTTGQPRLSHELEHGQTYDVAITNGGGLWRYRLGDLVECTGHVLGTPTLRFLGRGGRVSDLRGEKLSEPFVAEVVRALWSSDERPAYVALRARPRESDAGYELLISADHVPTDLLALSARVDAALARNPHYALARRLGQLQPVCIRSVDARAGDGDLRSHPGRLGDAKPRVLLTAQENRAD